MIVRLSTRLVDLIIPLGGQEILLSASFWGIPGVFNCLRGTHYIEGAVSLRVQTNVKIVKPSIHICRPDHTSKFSIIDLY